MGPNPTIRQYKYPYSPALYNRYVIYTYKTVHIQTGDGVRCRATVTVTAFGLVTVRYWHFRIVTSVLPVLHIAPGFFLAELAHGNSGTFLPFVLFAYLNTLIKVLHPDPKFIHKFSRNQPFLLTRLNRYRGIAYIVNIDRYKGI